MKDKIYISTIIIACLILIILVFFNISNCQEQFSPIPEKPYRIVISDTAYELEEKVCRYIADGYKPLGGVSVIILIEKPKLIERNSNYNYLKQYSQAIIKGE